MKDTDWTCDKCGSDNVMQEKATLVPMNGASKWEDGITCFIYNDFYWCEGCDEDCSPVRAYANSLTEHYEETE